MFKKSQSVLKLKTTSLLEIVKMCEHSRYKTPSLYLLCVLLISTTIKMEEEYDFKDKNSCDIVRSWSPASEWKPVQTHWMVEVQMKDEWQVSGGNDEGRP